MTPWHAFASEAPELAAAVLARFDDHPYKTMATLRRDGSPRISGVEGSVLAGELLVHGMPGSVKFRDLRRDPRMSLHSGSLRPPEWTGDAKVSGTAQEVVEPEARAAFTTAHEVPGDDFELWRLRLTEVVQVAVETDVLVVTSWHPGRGVERVERR